MDKFWASFFMWLAVVQRSEADSKSAEIGWIRKDPRRS